MGNAYLFLLRTSWRYADGARLFWVIRYIFFVISNSIDMTQPLIMGLIVNRLQRGGENVFRETVYLLILYASTTFFFWCFHGPGRIMERRAAFYVKQNYTDRLYRVVSELPLKWHRDHHSGETYDKVTKAASQLGHYAGQAYNHLHAFIAATLGVVAVLWYLHWFGLLALLLALLVVWVAMKFDAVRTKILREMNREENKVAAALFDYISNITTVITLRLEKRAGKEIARRFHNVKPVAWRDIDFNEWKWFAVSQLGAIMTFLLMFLYLYQEFSAGNVILAGSLIALYQYIDRLMSALWTLSWLNEEITLQATNVHMVDDIFADHEKLCSGREKVKALKDWQMIEVENLWFAYEDDQHRVHHIDGVSMTIHRGERIALIGESGSGKSTLMRLLRGVEVPKEASVVVDEQNVGGLAPLSTMTTLIPQDPEIFENTIEYNITAGIKHAKKDVEKACEIARFTPVLKRLPKGLKSDIKEKGVNLSGGENQRLALARGVFAARGSSLILLDEPTSSVDAQNEKAIYEALFKHFKGETIVSSLHKLHLLPLFDRAYVLKDGKIVEDGEVSVLLRKKGGVLRRLYDEYGE